MAVLLIAGLASLLGWVGGSGDSNDGGPSGSARERDGQEGPAQDRDAGPADEGRGDGEDPPAGASRTSFTAVDEAPSGNYVYDILVESDRGSTTSERVVTLDPVSEDAGERRQQIAYGTGQRDERIWAAEGIIVRVTHFGRDRCTWDSPWLHYQLPLTVGASWETQSECEVEEGGGSGTASMTESARVVEIRTRRVDGEPVVVAVLERERTLVIRGEIPQGATPQTLEFRAEDTITEEFSPERGLVVHAVTVARRTGLEGITEATETMTLRSLRPV